MVPLEPSSVNTSGEDMSKDKTPEGGRTGKSTFWTRYSDYFDTLISIDYTVDISFRFSFQTVVYNVREGGAAEYQGAVYDISSLSLSYTLYLLTYIPISIYLPPSHSLILSLSLFPFERDNMCDNCF